MTGQEPVKSLKKFAKFLKKELNLRGKDKPFEDFKVIELGCGEGKNLAYFAERGANCTGFDISSAAIENAKQSCANLDINFQVQDVETRLPLTGNSFDIALDIMTFHLIKDKEAYLKELSRLLKRGAYLFVKTFILDKDKNAKNLIKEFGDGKNSYTLPDFGIVEQVYYKKDLIDLYRATGFQIVYDHCDFHYMKFGNKKYKRHYFEAVLQRH